jgi:transposase
VSFRYHTGLQLAGPFDLGVQLRAQQDGGVGEPQPDQEDDRAGQRPDLAEDIAIEARLALHLTDELKELDERTALLLKQAHPTGILTSAPGVAAITATAILGRLGDPNRFTSLAGARAFTGLVHILDASGLTGRHGGPTKRGDAVLREALFMAAGQLAASTRLWPQNITAS